SADIQSALTTAFTHCLELLYLRPRVAKKTCQNNSLNAYTGEQKETVSRSELADSKSSSDSLQNRIQSNTVSNVNDCLMSCNSPLLLAYSQLQAQAGTLTAPQTETGAKQGGTSTSESSSTSENTTSNLNEKDKENIQAKPGASN